MLRIRALVRLPLARVLLPAAFALLLGGCLISFGSSNVTFSGATATYRATFTATLSTCTPQALPPSGSTVSCRIQLSTGQSWIATIQLPGIAPASLPPLFDPLIVQIPQSAGNFAGTVVGPGGGTLSVTPVTGTLFADATTPIVAEPGQQLVLIDLAPGMSLAPGVPYNFQLDFTTPNPLPTALVVKLLFAGKVVTGTPATYDNLEPKAQTTYYPPLFPCSPNFAAIPGVAIPPSGPINPLPLLTAQACNNVSYNFAGGTFGPIVEVVEFRNAALDHYFITWIADEIAILDAGVTIKGWTRTGRTFKAYSSPQANSSEICRFYIPPGLGDSHFFGRGTQECNDTATKFPAFTLEDPRFMHMVLPTLGVCPAGTVSVYRVFSNRPDANHRYMIDRAVRDQMVAAGWLPEGDGADQVVMCAPA